MCWIRLGWKERGFRSFEKRASKLEHFKLVSPLPGLSAQIKQTEPAVLWPGNISGGAGEVVQRQPGTFKWPLVKTLEALTES